MRKIKAAFCVLFLVSGLLSAQNDLDRIIQDYEQFEKNLKRDSPFSWSVESDLVVKIKLDFYRAALEDLEKLDSEHLSQLQAVNRDMLAYILSNRIYLLEYDKRFLPLNAEGGFIISLIYESDRYRLDTDKGLDNYLKNLKQVPDYLTFQKEMLTRGLARDLIHPRLVVQNCLDILEDVLSKGEDDFFMFKAASLNEVNLDLDLKSEVINAFSEFRDFIAEEYLPNARMDIGVSANKEGRNFYTQRVKYFTSLDLSPMQVYEIGLGEVERIKNEMEDILFQLEFDGNLQDFILMLKTDSRFYARSERELLYYASWLSKKAEAILPLYFGKLPRLPFTVKAVPAAIAPNYTTGRYSGGSFKKLKAGEYWVNTYKLDSRPLYMMTALTLHEAVPGHHLQGSLADELDGLPDFRSEYLSAFGEGWGLYSEYLGREAGMYESLYDLFGCLSYEMWRACRLVVDPGMHYMGWSRERAVNYMKEHTSLTDYEIENEIDRYIGWPGQALSYKIGEIKIKELRQLAETELGEDFDIREFHDTLLANGSVPLKTLERIIKDYISIKNSR